LHQFKGKGNFHYFQSFINSKALRMMKQIKKIINLEIKYPNMQCRADNTWQQTIDFVLLKCCRRDYWIYNPREALPNHEEVIYNTYPLKSISEQVQIINNSNVANKTSDLNDRKEWNFYQKPEFSKWNYNNDFIGSLGLIITIYLNILGYVIIILIFWRWNCLFRHISSFQ